MNGGPQFDHSTYLSPFSWRYGTEAMRAVWSEANKRLIWRRIWVALAEAQAELGLVTEAQVQDLRAHIDQVDLGRAEEIEARIHHDLMSEVHTFAEQCPVGGGIIHLGATSMDIEDNADALRVRQSLDKVIADLITLLSGLLDQVQRWASQATMAFTHLQPAEPTTIGYRLSQTALDLSIDLDDLRRLRAQVRGKGLKGATGTSAAYAQLLGPDVPPAELERRVMARLGLKAFPVSTQTYARKQDLRILSALSSLGQSLYKFAADLRLLQSPPLGELAEPFAASQIGSSAMPFKRNPINAENICSQARLLSSLPQVAWSDAAHSYLERTLDDSANRRVILPEAFLITDDLLRRAHKIVTGLRVDPDASARLLAQYGTFAATERVMMETAKRGGDRQALHEIIRVHCLKAWEALRQGAANPLAVALCQEPLLLEHARPDEIQAWLNASDYVGDAPERALALVAQVRAQLNEAP